MFKIEKMIIDINGCEVRLSFDHGKLNTTIPTRTLTYSERKELEFKIQEIMKIAKKDIEKK